MNDGFSEIKKDQRLVQSVWSEWELTEFLGAGKFGVVYKARKQSLAGDSFSAIKVVTIDIDDHKYGLSAEQADSYLASIAQKYTREIKMMENVKGYSNIVSIEDYSIIRNTGGNPWYILIRMELLTSLYEYLENRSVTDEIIIRIGIDLCKALEVCSSQKIVHRDIKPENVFVNRQGVFKLGDFGVASQILDDTSQTNFCSQDYTAPEIYHRSIRIPDFEQAQSADIYSLGLLLYWIANGKKLPFIEKDLVEPREIDDSFSRRINGEKLPKPVNISDALGKIILKACAYQPQERFSSAEEFRKALETTTLPPPPPPPPSPLRIILIVSICLLLIGAAFMILRPSLPFAQDKTSDSLQANSLTVLGPLPIHTEAPSTSLITTPDTTPLPMEAPTLKPTDTPTTKPTDTPTTKPTDTPTTKPTDTPTTKPTDTPTTKPTDTPTTKPTDTPTTKPTDTPTTKPTDTPTTKPTDTPTTKPTDTPTTKPTDTPTTKPTDTPTTKPTDTPTTKPTDTPVPKVPTLSDVYSPKENVHFTGNAASGQRWYAHYGPGEEYLQVKGGFSPDGTNARGNYHETPLNVYFCENGWYLANVLYNGHGRIVYLPYESISSKNISTISKLNSYEGKTIKDTTTSWLPEITNNTEDDDFKVAKGTRVKVFFIENNYFFAEFQCSGGLVRMWLPKDSVSFQ